MCRWQRGRYRDSQTSRTHGEAAAETKCGVDGRRRFRSSCMKTPIQLLSLTTVTNSVTCDGCLSLRSNELSLRTSRSGFMSRGETCQCDTCCIGHMKATWCGWWMQCGYGPEARSRASGLHGMMRVSQNKPNPRNSSSTMIPKLLLYTRNRAGRNWSMVAQRHRMWL